MVAIMTCEKGVQLRCATNPMVKQAVSSMDPSRNVQAVRDMCSPGQFMGGDHQLQEGGGYRTAPVCDKPNDKTGRVKHGS